MTLFDEIMDDREDDTDDFVACSKCGACDLARDELINGRCVDCVAGPPADRGELRAGASHPVVIPDVVKAYEEAGAVTQAEAQAVAAEPEAVEEVDTPQGLEGKYGFPPFTVLDARAGSWQSRKASWIRLGLASEETRDDVLGGLASFRKDPKWAGSIPKNLAVSVFDPVLCELAVRWFSPKGGNVLDPFAGGSVRGVVAAACGRTYLGIDLRKEQVMANEAQWKLLADRVARSGETSAPVWVIGDSRTHLSAHVDDACADLVFSCPPYADLEVYSDDPRDLSAMPAKEFTEAYAHIIRQSCRALRNDRFAVWVIGNIRDNAGHVRDLVSETTRAFQSGGLHLYNDAILLSPVGTARLRAGQFRQTRVMPRVHQHLLVYVKGDRRKATAACGEIGGFPALSWDAQQVGFSW